MSKCNIPREVIAVDISVLPEIVKKNIADINNCHVYLTIASYDGSYMYTAFNTKSKTASRVTLYNVIN